MNTPSWTREGGEGTHLKGSLALGFLVAKEGQGLENGVVAGDNVGKREWLWITQPGV